jgi:hypothetical protein
MPSASCRVLCCSAPIMSLISPVELRVFWARARISSATTAKPRPCSPARAASMAVEGEQVGLIRNLPDHLQNAVDLLAVLVRRASTPWLASSS